jgi:hypothetical protein
MPILQSSSFFKVEMIEALRNRDEISYGRFWKSLCLKSNCYGPCYKLNNILHWKQQLQKTAPLPFQRKTIRKSYPGSGLLSREKFYIAPLLNVYKQKDCIIYTGFFGLHANNILNAMNSRNSPQNLCTGSPIFPLLRLEKPPPVIRWVPAHKKGITCCIVPMVLSFSSSA